MLLNSELTCFGNEVYHLPLNPAVVGKESIHSFDDKAYSEAETTIKVLQGQLKFERELKSSDYSLSAQKQGPQKSFFVNNIILIGNTKLGSGRFKKMFEGYEGKEITIDDLKDICNEITEYYHSKGYITSQARLLAQKVDDGKVEITIEEGKYGQINIRGNKWTKKQYLNNVLSIYEIEKDGVLNVYNLQNAVEELNNKKYIKGNLIIEQKENNKISDIVLDVQDRLPLNLDGNFNNFGTDLTGVQRTLVMGSYENLTGRGDRLSLGAILGSGNLGALAGYSIPVNKRGTMLNLGYSVFNTNYGGMYRDIGLYGKWSNYSIGLTHPLVRKGQWAVDGNVNFDICDVTQGLDLLGDLSQQKLRVLRTGISTRRIDKRGFWSSNLQASTGLPLLGATELSQGADGQFVKANLSLNRLQFMPKRSMLLFSINGQFTPNELMMPEKAALGGTSMRGYETASILGDNGIFGTIEYRMPVPGLRKLFPEKFKSFEDGIKLGFFYDYGILGNVNGIKNVVSSKSTNFLQSIGMGIHVPVGRFLMANLDFGIPIGDPSLINQGARFTFSLTSSMQDMWRWKDSKL